jgi:FAD/FMN-containing dehydrogenase
MRYKDQELSGWNHFPKCQCRVTRPERYSELVPDSSQSQIARGLGRSYSDMALNEAGQVVLTTRLNRILAFDHETGILRAESGVSLDEIIETFLPRGWFLPVTPGTRFVTLGGCIANDVHGKNHHNTGSFASCVRALTLVTAGGEHLQCSPATNPQIFWATLGGLGLTGFISEVAIQLRRVESGYMHVEHHAGEDLDELIELMAEDISDYSVAWIDCLAKGNKQGRGIYMQGRHLEEDELAPEHRIHPLNPDLPRPRTLPFNLPRGVLNRFSVKAFNAWYYAREAKKASFASDYHSYFYPLDSIHHWNRMYGSKGFIQYQCVLPLESSSEGMHQLLDELQRQGHASFLAVLKRMGPGNQAPLSFPMEGYTLAVDIPVSGMKAAKLVTELNAITLEHEGRVYLAKDALLKPEAFRVMYPRWEEWLALKRELDPQWRFESMLSRRLEMNHE